MAFAIDLTSDENVVMSIDFELVFDAVWLSARTATKDLWVGEFFAWQELCLIDHSHSTDASKEGPVVGDGKTEDGIREFVLDRNVQRLGEAVSSIGFFDDGEFLSLAKLVVELGD